MCKIFEPLIARHPIVEWQLGQHLNISNRGSLFDFTRPYMSHQPWNQPQDLNTSMSNAEWCMGAALDAWPKQPPHVYERGKSLRGRLKLNLTLPDSIGRATCHDPRWRQISFVISFPAGVFLNLRI